MNNNQIQNSAVYITVLAMLSVVVYADGPTSPMDFVVSAVCLVFALVAHDNLDANRLGKITNSLILGTSLIYTIGFILSWFTFFNFGGFFIDNSVFSVPEDQPLGNFSIGDAAAIGLGLVIFLKPKLVDNLQALVLKFLLEKS